MHYFASSNVLPTKHPHADVLTRGVYVGGHMAAKDISIRVRCKTCGGGTRNHRVIYKHAIQWLDKQRLDPNSRSYRHYEIVACLGCDTVRFRTSETSSEYVEYDEESNTADYPEYNIHIYPDEALGARPPEDWSRYPKDVAKMYVETLKCFNAGAFTLAGGGLRAIVEAICQDRQVTVGPLETKINALVKQKISGANSGGSSA